MLRYVQQPLDVEVNWFWQRIASNAKDTLVGNREPHRKDLGEFKADGAKVSKRCDSLVKEGALNTDQQVVGQLLGTRPIGYSDLTLGAARDVGSA